MDEIILFTNIAPNNLQTQRDLEFGKLIHEYSQYDISVYYKGHNRGLIWNSIGNIKIFNKPIRSITNKIVLLFGYSEYFLDLHHSNKIIYLARKPHLNKNEILLLGKLNHIIAESKNDSFQLQSQVSQYRNNLIVSNLLPWTDSKKYKISQYEQNSIGVGDIHWNRQLFNSFKTHKLIHPTANFCIEPSTRYETIKCGLLGRPLITSPKNDLIISGFNGYVAHDTGEVIAAINALSKLDHARELGFNSRKYFQALLDPNQYLKRFNQIIDNKISSLSPLKINSCQDWIIKEKVLSQGQFKYFPEKLNKKFKTVDLQDFNEIIEFFSKRHFGEVYIFGFCFPEYDYVEMHKARSITKRLGKRGLKIHFCLDEQIPSAWRNIFNNLSVISTEEGLKQAS